jgi:anti-anti-sigma factor
VSGPDLRIGIEERDDEIHVAVAGDLDLLGEERLEAELDRVWARRPAKVVIDLRGLMFLDARGVAAIWHASERAAANGAALRIVKAAEPVQRIFRLLDLEGQLEFVSE